ncbi:MAG: hypothetical protein K0Q53_2446 [Massilibacillus sp.]|jgi:hypothetical protein|nr:hypothetical protein [Massilibacillus sp.]
MKQTMLLQKMIEYFAGDAKRIQHFIKVHSFAKVIGQLEEIDEKQQLILETAAIVHDIGIKNSEIKYKSSAGKYQEIEGPAPAKAMLLKLGYENIVIERVCYLIAHHHTYDHIEGNDYQILVEADFLVNLYEDGVSEKAVQTVKKNIFKTASGTRLLTTMYA